MSEEAKNEETKEKGSEKKSVKLIDDPDFLQVPLCDHVPGTSWKKADALNELDELRKWLSDGDPTKINFGRFTAERGYSRQRITDWVEKWPRDKRIQELYRICQDLQQNKYLVGGLLKLYSSKLSQFGLINVCGMKPATQTIGIEGGDPGKPITGKIEHDAPPAVLEYLKGVIGGKG